MNGKLFPNIRRLTIGFCIAILCMTLSTLALRLTVFSDMAAVPETAITNLFTSTEDDYAINTKIYFASADAKGDVLITNLSTENLINVDLSLASSGDSILSTGLMKPGKSIKAMQLNAKGKQLEEGVYDCIAEVSAYATDDHQSAIGATRAEVVLYIGQKPEPAKK